MSSNKKKLIAEIYSCAEDVEKNIRLSNRTRYTSSNNAITSFVDPDLSKTPMLIFSDSASTGYMRPDIRVS
ncbi:hypothetical protein LIER_43567 [Lithospermum erythrorhizon]|uniref:Uncharacterized protein n=1 Tax=Lithospermum erythrorhizon TaxID=34254 RepID=A0AAV3QE07_LITER